MSTADHLPPLESRINILVDSCVFIDSFDPASDNHVASLALLEELARRGVVVTMPAHGWFEVQCTLQRLRSEGRFVGPLLDGRQQYPLKLIHIDDKFIGKYAMADLPYIKAGDHIFLAVAKVNGISLITNDGTLIKVAKSAGVSVFTPAEALAEARG